MDVNSDTTTKEVKKTVKEKQRLVDIEAMVIFSDYEILEDGTRIFSAED